jgi:hypothetical protein
MATTTNYGWDTPDDTDLVKDGALAIRDLGQDIDTSLYNKIYGATRQLAANSSYTNQTTFADIANGADKTALDLSVVKKQNSSLLVVHFSMAVYLNSGNAQNFYGAVNIGGTDYALAGAYALNAVSSNFMSGTRVISGINAGTYAAKPRFAAGAASNFLLPALTYISYSIQEVPQ